MRKRLGDLLLEAGVVDEAQIAEALQVQRDSGQRVGEVLVDLGYVTEEQMVVALADLTGLPRAGLDHIDVAPQMLDIIPPELIQRYQVFPVKLDDGVLHVAMIDPYNIRALDDIRSAVRMEIRPMIASRGEIKRAYQRHFDVQASARDVFERYGGDDEEEVAIEEDLGDSPGIQVVDLILSQAVQEGASDIHIEPQEGRTLIRFRVDGRLREVMDVPRRLSSDMVSRIKVMAELDITNRRTPQDGRTRVTIDDMPVDLRVSTLPIIHGEKVVLRLLSRSSGVVAVDDLGFQTENITAVKQMLAHRHGMILVTGPTGSGKTTTLYSFLHALNTPEVNIITIEDPVEVRVDRINQVGVSPRTGGITFASALRSVLRQDPDVVMIGEMRDQETAEIAIRAALTGHLVLSTLHTNSAAATLGRLIDMDIEPFLVSGTVIGIVAQRLVRRLCMQCREPVDRLDPAEARFMGERVAGARLYRAKGCAVCRHVGFSGRVAIEEVLLMTRELKNLVQSGAPEEDIVAASRREGMVTLRESGIRRVLAGETTAREVMGSVYSIVEEGREAGADGTEALQEATNAWKR